LTLWGQFDIKMLYKKGEQNLRTKNSISKTILTIFFVFLTVSLIFPQQQIKEHKNIGKFISTSTIYGGPLPTQGSSTAIITGTDIGHNIYITDPYNGNQLHVFSGTFKGTLDGVSTKFYCIDLQHELQFNKNYTDDGSTNSEITYILNNYFPYNHYPYTGSLSSVQEEAAAVQVAIWHFSDGVDANTVDVTNIKTRALEIINDANTNAGNTITPATLILTPPSQSVANGAQVTMTVGAYDINGNPVSNLNVTLTTNSGTLNTASVTTGTNGTASFTLDQGSGNSATVTAKAEVIIPHGTKYINVANPTGKQKLVLATPTKALGNSEADVSWNEEADLSLLKTVDNNNPNNGDIINFTITVTNHGPANATGVEATDLLPTGFNYQSDNPSQGSYNHTTGVWTIGSLAANASVSLQITVKVSADSSYNSSFDLGPAKGYNVFILKNLMQPSSDTQGKMAVGGNANLFNYSVGDQLSPSNGTVDVLIVGHKLTFSSGAVTGGNVVYGTSTNLPKDNVSITGGTLRRDHPINFGAAKTYLKNLSTHLGSYTVNGTTTFQWGGFTLTGTDPFLNVFKISGSDLSIANNMQINVPNGATVLVNITGKNVRWSGGLIVSGTDVNNVLYNFYKAKTLKVHNIDIRGSILAPRAAVNFASGVINGQLIAKSLGGPGQFNNGQFNNKLFIGNIPYPTKITNIAEITASDQTDPNSTPNNGNDTENDYSKVLVTINPNSGSNSSNNGGNNSATSWNLASSFPINEIVWSLADDNNGNLLAGTIGGHLLKSDDHGTTWEIINKNMSVGFIWSIIVNNSGKIFIGTEKGIYYSTDNGNSFDGPVLAGNDVRALAINGNSIFAGTWGNGVYKSTDDGTTWTKTDNGLSPYGLAVHALTVDSHSNIYAGTFGGGVYKSTDNGATWVKTSIGYQFIWGLAVTSDDVLYAATYGAGVYRSTDGGNNWTQINNGLSAKFVYSVVVDASNNVYANTWTGDVYLLASNQSSSAEKGNVNSTMSSSKWTSIGLGGYGVSSLIIDPAESTVFAGTKNGSIYKLVNKTTGVKQESNIPVKFALRQNYPNPFNPTTTIEFSIPKAGFYSLNVYNILGQKVAVLINSNLNSGYHKVQFNGSNMASGVYIYQLSGKNVSIIKKMILMK